MSVTISVREVAIRPQTGSISTRFAAVTFSIKSDAGPDFEITFQETANAGLDAPVLGAKTTLELFAADLAAAAKDFTFP